MVGIGVEGGWGTTPKHLEGGRKPLREPASHHSKPPIWFGRRKSEQLSLLVPHNPFPKERKGCRANPISKKKLKGWNPLGTGLRQSGHKLARGPFSNLRKVASVRLQDYKAITCLHSHRSASSQTEPTSTFEYSELHPPQTTTLRVI